MKFYSTIFTLHIMFAGAWLINLVFNSILRKRIVIIKHKASEKKFISLYMTFANLFGMIGATGILITGISMVLLNPGYGFFLMTSNHWLATKQILMVALLITIGAFIIPTAKKIRAAIG